MELLTEGVYKATRRERQNRGQEAKKLCESHLFHLLVMNLTCRPVTVAALSINNVNWTDDSIKVAWGRAKQTQVCVDVGECNVDGVLNIFVDWTAGS